MSDTIRCGHVAVVGRTNTGKSTLLNRIVGEKIAIVSPTPQTTRNTIIGLVNAYATEDGRLVRHPGASDRTPVAQVVLVDTPGFHKPQHELNRRMVREAEAAMDEVEVIVALVDVSDRPGKGDDFVLQRVRAAGPPFVIALNKIDRMGRRSELLPLIQRYWELGPQAVVPISAETGDGIDELLKEVVALLPEAPPEYPLHLTTDQNEMFLVTELIREKVLLATREEIPHATTVVVESIEDRPRKGGKDVIVVTARLLVEKENQKGILIGKGGTMLKRIGMAARQDIEEQLGVTCHLDLEVGLHPHWREDDAMLDELFISTRAVFFDRDPPGEEE